MAHSGADYTNCKQEVISMKSVKNIFRKAGHYYDEKCAVLSAALVTLPGVSAFAMGSSWNDVSGNVGSTLGDDIKWPWTRILNSFAQQVTGPLPMTLGILGIAAAAIAMFTGNHGAGTTKIIAIVFGLSIAIFAPSAVNLITSSAGGLMISGL